jgi:hypothetical protein
VMVILPTAPIVPNSHSTRARLSLQTPRPSISLTQFTHPEPVFNVGQTQDQHHQQANNHPPSSPAALHPASTPRKYEAIISLDPPPIDVSPHIAVAVAVRWLRRTLAFDGSSEPSTFLPA